MQRLDYSTEERPDIRKVGHIDTDRCLSQVPKLVRCIVDITESEYLGYDCANNLEIAAIFVQRSDLDWANDVCRLKRIPNQR